MKLFFNDFFVSLCLDTCGIYMVLQNEGTVCVLWSTLFHKYAVCFYGHAIICTEKNNASLLRIAA